MLKYIQPVYFISYALQLQSVQCCVHPMQCLLWYWVYNMHNRHRWYLQWLQQHLNPCLLCRVCLLSPVRVPPSCGQWIWNCAHEPLSGCFKWGTFRSRRDRLFSVVLSDSSDFISRVEVDAGDTKCDSSVSLLSPNYLCSGWVEVCVGEGEKWCEQ